VECLGSRLEHLQLHPLGDRCLAPLQRRQRRELVSLAQDQQHQRLVDSLALHRRPQPQELASLAPRLQLRLRPGDFLVPHLHHRLQELVSLEVQPQHLLQEDSLEHLQLQLCLQLEDFLVQHLQPRVQDFLVGQARHKHQEVFLERNLGH
jgi:hypothetical protein